MAEHRRIQRLPSPDEKRAPRDPLRRKKNCCAVSRTLALLSYYLATLSVSVGAIRAQHRFVLLRCQTLDFLSAQGGGEGVTGV